MKEIQKMKGYKGFSKGLVCRGKQYQENTVFKEENAEICKSGMHFCENPFDVLDYYGFVGDNGELNEFCEVESLDEVKTDNNKKFCTKKLKIGAKLGIAGLVNAFVDFTLSKINSEDVVTNTGDWSAAINIGYLGKAAVSGEDSVAISIGISGKAKGSLGCYITLAEWEQDENEKYHLIFVKSCKVDGEKIKADTFYTLKDGEFVETKNE